MKDRAEIVLDEKAFQTALHLSDEERTVFRDFLEMIRENPEKNIARSEDLRFPLTSGTAVVSMTPRLVLMLRFEPSPGGPGKVFVEDIASKQFLERFVLQTAS